MKFPLIVKWSITDRCNLRCKHCYRSNRINEITREEADLIIEELYKNKVGCVALTGGEPCLAQEFIYIVELLHEKGIKTEIATNGYYITDDMINMFKKNQISIIQISVDGYNKKVNDFIRGAGTFEIIKNNIKLLLDNGIKVVIAHTLNHYNCRYMDYMVNFFHEIKATALRFEVYIPICEDRFNLKLDIEDIKFIKRK